MIPDEDGYYLLSGFCRVCDQGVKHFHFYPWGTVYLPGGYVHVDLGEAVLMTCPNMLELWALVAQGEACSN